MIRFLSAHRPLGFSHSGMPPTMPHTTVERIVRSLHTSEMPQSNPAPHDLAAVARRLVSEHSTALPFKPFASQSGILTLADAYQVQEMLVRAWQDGHGGTRVGYKIGLTSRAMQAMCRIDSPVSGVILSERVRTSPADIPARQFMRLGLEFEVGVRIGRDTLRAAGAPPFDSREIAQYVSGVCAAIELVDDRNCDYETLDVLSLVADNSWNAGVVTGNFAAADLESLDSWPGIVYANGAEIGRGHGRDALGHPFIPLAWIANRLADAGHYLRAGDLVMTGSLIKTQFPKSDTRYAFDLGGGTSTVECTVGFD